MGGVKVYRADAAFAADDKNYPAGTFVVPMTQVFARYAKDLLEKQTYPEVRRSPTSPPEPPYDVTAWSLGMLLGVDVTFVKNPLPEGLALTPVPASPRRAGAVTGTGAVFAFDYTGPEGAIAINRLLKAGGARCACPGRGGRCGRRRHRRRGVRRAAEDRSQDVSAALGLQTRAAAKRAAVRGDGDQGAAHRRSISPGRPTWTKAGRAGCIEQHEFPYTTLHNADVKAGRLRERFDVDPVRRPAAERHRRRATTRRRTRPEYRGGIGDDGVAALKAFVARGRHARDAGQRVRSRASSVSRCR